MEIRTSGAVAFFFLLLGCGGSGDRGSGGAGAMGNGGSGGERGDGGSVGTGAGGAGAGGMPQPHPGACNDLGAVGTWQSIVPKEVSLDPAFQTPAGMNYGAHSLVVNPLDSSVIYLGTSAQGIYKSTDCGATWKHINTGKNGDKLDHGRQWTFLIDPVDPDVLYTNSGYSPDPTGSIAWKSTNGGVDWEEFVSPEYVAALQFHNFVHMMSIDPTDHLHLLVTPHFACEPGSVNGLPKTANCLLETKDAGKTWRILEGTPDAGEGTGHFIQDAKTWFWAASFGGMYRTIDGGGSWQKVYDGGYADPGGVSPSKNIWFTGAEFNVLTSTDDGMTWNVIPNSPGASNVAADATDIFVSRGAGFSRAKAKDPTKWTALASPPFKTPDSVKAWAVRYDADHHVLYSLNSTDGLWRLRLE
jgi:photosystem II stability/assembly factor-like uncharacterized protein